MTKNMNEVLIKFDFVGLFDCNSQVSICPSFKPRGKKEKKELETFLKANICNII